MLSMEESLELLKECYQENFHPEKEFQWYVIKESDEYHLMYLAKKAYEKKPKLLKKVRWIYHLANTIIIVKGNEDSIEVSIFKDKYHGYTQETEKIFYNTINELSKNHQLSRSFLTVEKKKRLENLFNFK
jgi:hypothetical protein